MDTDPIDAIAVLAEPTRRRLYEWVARQPEAVGRDAAAEAAGTSRALAAHHLDRLVEAGLLTPEFRRLSGRTGPGAGRPAKLYRRAEADIEVSVPARNYRLAADLLAQGAEAGEATPTAGLRAAARAHGQRLGLDARAGAGRRPSRRAAKAAVLATLEANGYEPVAAPRGGEIRLANCPFDALVEEHRDLVCGMNLAMVDGLIGAVDPKHLSARLDPQPGCCCVAISSVGS